MRLQIKSMSKIPNSCQIQQCIVKYIYDTCQAGYHSLTFQCFLLQSTKSRDSRPLHVTFRFHLSLPCYPVFRQAHTERPSQKCFANLKACDETVDIMDSFVLLLMNIDIIFHQKLAIVTCRYSCCLLFHLLGKH